MTTEIATVETKSPERTSGDGGVAELLRAAVDRGVDVDILERLVALKERVDEKESRRAFFEALAAFQANCPPLPKSGVVDYTPKSGGRVKYRFAPLDVIARAIRPVLHRYGLSYSWDSEFDGGNIVVTCTVRHIDGHLETATFRCAVGEAGSPSMNGAQKAGSAITYGERYSLVQALGLTTASDDVDGLAPDGSGHPSGTISEEQEAELNSLMQEVGADGARFLKFFEVSSLAELPASRLAQAVAMLEQKRGAA